MELSKDELTTLFTDMVRVRALDDMFIKALKGGADLAFFHSQHGQEAVGAGVCSFLRKDDYVCYSHRGHGIGKLLPKGLSARAILAEHFGKSTGSCGGVSQFHAADMDLGIPGLSGTLGGEFMIAVGLAITAKMRKKEQVVVCIQGEGTYGRGTFHESMMMAANWKLPLVYVVENNRYMGCTPIEEIHAMEDVADLAKGYGVPGIVADGQDVVAVHEAAQSAILRARDGNGPSIVECKTYRIRSHAEGIPDLKIVEPRPKEEIEKWKKRDPIMLMKNSLMERGLLTGEEMEEIERAAAQEMNEAFEQAVADPPTEPAILSTLLYAE